MLDQFTPKDQQGKFNLFVLLIFIEIGVLFVKAYDFINNETSISKFLQTTQSESQFRYISNQMGYTHLIHNFKNYLIRYDGGYYTETYYQRAKENISEIKKNIVTLKETSPKKIVEDLEVIYQTVLKYEENLERIKIERAKSSDVTLVDKSVLIDDRPAERAFNRLSGAYQRLQDQEFVRLIEKKRQDGIELISVVVVIVLTIFYTLYFDYRERMEILTNSRETFRNLISEIDNPLFIFNKENQVTFENSKAKLLRAELNLSQEEKSIEAVLQSLEKNNPLTTALNRLPYQNQKHTTSLNFLNMGKNVFECSLEFPFGKYETLDSKGILLISDKTDFIQSYRGAELHHRIKNNLAFLSSIVGMYKAQDRSNKELGRILDSISGKINSIAALYDRRQGLDEKDAAELSLYLKDIAKKIELSSMGAQISLSLNIDKELILSPDKVIPLGIIFSELVTNSLKHGENSNLTINLEVNKVTSDCCHFVYQDDGPTIDIDAIENSNGMGMRIIRILAQQINTELKISNSGKNTFELLPIEKGAA